MIFSLQNLIIILVLVPLSCISWKKIQWGVYLVVFLLPAYLIRTEIFGIPTTALELGIYVLFIVWLASAYRSKQLREATSKIFSDRLFAAGAFLLISGAAISAIFAVDLRAGAGILKGWFFDPFLFFIILTSIIRTPEQKENVLKAFFASGSGIAAISLVYWFSPHLGGVSYDGRLHAFYASPNYLAMYLAPALIIGIWGFLLKRNLSQTAPDSVMVRQAHHDNKMACHPELVEGRSNLFYVANNFPSKIFWLVPSVIIAVAIYLAFSYAAWISLFVAVILAIYLMAINDKKLSFQWKLSFLSDTRHGLQKRLVLVTVVFLIFVAAFLSQSGSSKFSNLKNMAYRSSFNSRLMIWRAAWEIGKDNPLIGIGPGNFQRYYLDYQSRVLGTEPYLEWAVPEPHNIFLAFWLETGILGLLGFITLIFRFFKKNLDAFKKTRLDSSLDWISESRRASEAKRPGDAASKRLAIVLCSIMIYILLHGLVDTTYWKNDLSVIFWMVLGLAFTAGTIPEK